MSVGLFMREVELERLAKKWRKRPGAYFIYNYLIID